MEVIDIGSWNAYDQAMGAAKKAILADEAVVLPTDTLYGLCASSLSKKALDNMVGIKREREHKPIAVIVSDLRMMRKYCEVPDKVAVFLQQLMPGPVTVILKKKYEFPEAITKTDKVGVRIPHYIFTTKLVSGLGFPLAATSANVSGEQAPNNVSELDERVSERVAVVVDGGPTRWKRGSTVIDFTLEKPKILREGAQNVFVSQLLEDYASWEPPTPIQ